MTQNDDLGRNSEKNSESPVIAIEESKSNRDVMGVS